MADTSIKDFGSRDCRARNDRQEARRRRPGHSSNRLLLYERGVQLSRFFHAHLEEAERRIEILNERGELKAGAERRSEAASVDRG